MARGRKAKEFENDEPLSEQQEKFIAENIVAAWKAEIDQHRAGSEITTFRDFALSIESWHPWSWR